MALIKDPKSVLVGKLEGVHLFHFDGAPCAQRVRFALAEKGLSRGREVRFDADDATACAGEQGAWTSRIVSLIKKDHLSATYADIHPNLVVPALVHDGRLYRESMEIIEYLDEAFGGEPLVPKYDPEQLAEAEALTQLGKQLHQSIRFVTFRWGLGSLAKLNAEESQTLKRLASQGSDEEKLAAFYEGYSNDAIDESVYVEHLRKLNDAFAMLESRFADGRPFITGPTLTMADVIWAMKVLRLTECGYPFGRYYPGVNAWFVRIKNRPSFRMGVMGKHKFLNNAFKIKAAIETVLGIGLVKAMDHYAFD
ncbi:MAG: glutathione S-transferase family protein [Pseudomonadota bacterium]